MTHHAWHILRSLAATTLMVVATSCASVAATRQNTVATAPNLPDCSNLLVEATTLTLAFSDTIPSRAAMAQAAYAAKLAEYQMCLAQRATASS